MIDTFLGFGWQPSKNIRKGNPKSTLVVTDICKQQEHNKLDIKTLRKKLH